MKAKSTEPTVRQTLEEGISKTGFVLEHKVASIFELSQWSVIHNRYYLDDVTEGQREMDMIAYKIHENKGVLIYTALIISCKKSDEFDWVSNSALSYLVSNYRFSGNR